MHLKYTMAEADTALAEKLRLIEFILVDGWEAVCQKVSFRELLDTSKLAQTKAVEFKDKMKDVRFTEEERAIVSNANLYAIRTHASRSSRQREAEEERGVELLSDEKRGLELQKESMEEQLKGHDASK